MPDKEKVNKGLEVCTKPGTRGCFYDIKECPYDENGCRMALMRDALALLNQQENDIHHMGLIIEEYEKELKKEPVKPHYNARTNWYECGACHYSMTSGMHCRGELIPAYKVGFCAKCGKAVIWK